MSVFVLKLIAVCTMLIDHLGFFLFPRFCSKNVYIAMRAIGRVAFPIYCFLIVNGFQKTRDVRHYLSRLVFFALISQIPYVLTFHNVRAPSGQGFAFSLVFPWYLALTLPVAAGVCWYLSVRRDWSALLPTLALLTASVELSFHGIPLLLPELNVFYTLSLGLGCIALLSSLSGAEPDWKTLLPRLLLLASALLILRDNADYGLAGVAFIVCLWLTRSNRLSMSVVVLLWCALKHVISYFSLPFLFGTALSLVPMLCYNGKLGRPIKHFFYYIYPAHLLVLGLLTTWQVFHR